MYVPQHNEQLYYLNLTVHPHNIKYLFTFFMYALCLN
jgi:hypothetical protein